MAGYSTRTGACLRADLRYDMEQVLQGQVNRCRQLRVRPLKLGKHRGNGGFPRIRPRFVPMSPNSGAHPTARFFDKLPSVEYTAALKGMVSSVQVISIRPDLLSLGGLFLRP